MKKQVIIDVDIGGDVDDAYALAFALQSEELDIRAILTSGRFGADQAKIANEIVKVTDRDIPIFQGVNRGKGVLTEMNIPKNSNFSPKKLEENIQFFKDMLSKKIYYISLGPCSNIGYLLEKIPELTKHVEFLVMGGAIKKDYKGRDLSVAEWNMRADLEAAKALFDSSAKMTLVGLDATWDLELSEKNIQKIRDSGSAINNTINKIYTSWKKYMEEKINVKKQPVLFDPLTISLLIDESLADFKEYKLSIDESGKTIENPKGKDVKVAIKSDKKRFLKLFMERILKR